VFSLSQTSRRKEKEKKNQFQRCLVRATSWQRRLLAAAGSKRACCTRSPTTIVAGANRSDFVFILLNVFFLSL
jgi:hypothetical protein